jgi:O-acetyl-ADP-ribose deacetylase (regulator of RNase III)
MPAPGARVRDYEVWGRLGEGGMSEVWLAKHAVLSVPVVMKTLRAAMDPDDEHGFDRILNEARLMARIASPRVVRAIDAGVHEGVGYVVQEYVDGIDLAELDQRRRMALGVGLPLWFVCHVMQETCFGLHASHQHGVIHRDVKPSNIFGSPETGIRLGDFGIALSGQQARAPNEVSGTFRFMAPEQLAGGPLSRAVDVYGAGATAFDLRYGRAPFADLAATLDPRTEPRFPVTQTPSEAYFQHVVRGMLTYDAAARPRNLSELARHFGALAQATRPPPDRAGCTRISRDRLRLGDCEITFETGDIVEIRAEGVVSSAHYHMSMRTGVGNAVRERGGDAIEAEAMKDGDRALGTCVATTAGKLDARYVLHAVSAWNEVSCVGRAAHRTLLLAEDLGLKSLAIPALGTGASRVTTEACANALATALRTHLLLGGTRLRHVRFVLRDDDMLAVFREVAEDALRGGEQLPAWDLGLEVDGEVSAEGATHVRASQQER